ncbi:hypothetical protein VNO77_23596 [Canavalia gladiata]|uniref:Uncharacterized protein n=1 Tax=Canavalia gladiata TaxID=3824 RepID=A0AAN9L822_CANGL
MEDIVGLMEATEISKHKNYEVDDKDVIHIVSTKFKKQSIKHERNFRINVIGYSGKEIYNSRITLKVKKMSMKGFTNHKVVEGFHRQVIANEADDYYIPHHRGRLLPSNEANSGMRTTNTREKAIILILIPYFDNVCLENFNNFIGLGEME